MSTRDPDIERLERIVKDRIRLREVRERSKRLRAAMIAALGSLLAAIATGYSFVNLIHEKPPREIVDTRPIDLSPLRSDIAQSKKDIEALRASISAIQKPPTESAIAAEQAKLSSQLALVSKRLESIESSILESPEKSLSIPLLRKDIDEISRHSSESRAIEKAEIDRLYAQQTWMLGGIGTVLLAITGGAITIIFRSLPSGKKNEDEA